MRVRGAFGRVLHDFGPPILDRYDPAARPRAWDVLFEPMEAPGGRGAIAKPLVVRADVIGDRVIASVGLVGAAVSGAPTPPQRSPARSRAASRVGKTGGSNCRSPVSRRVTSASPVYPRHP